MIRQTLMAIALVLLLGMQTVLRADWEGGMCVECDSLDERLTVVESKLLTFRSGRDSLLEAQRELLRSKEASDLLAATYSTLKGTAMVLSVATLKCPVDEV